MVSEPHEIIDVIIIRQTSRLNWATAMGTASLLAKTVLMWKCIYSRHVSDKPWRKVDNGRDHGKFLRRV
ncbi:MAG: hypothetical protein EA424_08780 [Planctomycetaceae bacterium]|nr:MAG: hypothetical protein EA424_08780 [Planctomycetaceae bacterium]